MFPDNATISDNCRDLIAKILVADPLQRVTIADIFKHPWVQHVSGQLHPASHVRHTDGLTQWLASAAAGGCCSIPLSALAAGLASPP